MDFGKELRNLRQEAKTWGELALLTVVEKLWQRCQEKQQITLRHARHRELQAKLGEPICMN